MTTILDSIQQEVKNWWWFLVIGILSVATGFIILSKPATAYVSLSVLFSVVMVCTGISQIIFSLSVSGVMRGWGWSLVSGIIDLAIGTYLLMYPVVTMATLPYFVGFYLIFRAFNLIGTSIDLNAFSVPGWGWLLAGGISVLALGFLVLRYPVAGAAGIVGVSAAAFILSGIFNMVLAFQLKGFKTQVEHPDRMGAGRVTVSRGEEHRHTN